jgi:hypothetical protein
MDKMMKRLLSVTALAVAATGTMAAAPPADVESLEWGCGWNPRVHGRLGIFVE